MAKRKKVSMDELSKVLDDSAIEATFDAFTSIAKQNFPGVIYSGTEAEQLLVCLPVPSLAIRYLLQQEGWPLGRFTMLVGEQESCKSSLSYEIIRWHRMARGKGLYIDTEFKPAPALMQSLLRYDSRACDYYKCKTLEEWQSVLINTFTSLKELMDGTEKQPGIGRSVPYACVVDSLTAAIATGAFDQMTSDGHPSRRFADEARSLTDYMKVIPKLMDDTPFSLIGIGHLKMGQTPQGLPVRNIAGGKGLRFHEATEIEMRRRSSTNPTTKGGSATRKIDGNDCEFIELQICTTKNSNAPHKYVDVDMIWYTDFDQKVECPRVDPKTGVTRVVYDNPQITYFDWNTTAIEILLGIQKERTNRAKALAEVLYIEAGDDRRYSYCKALGVSEREKVSWAKLGEILESRLAEDPNLADQLYPILGIRRRFMFTPGVDIRTQSSMARDMAKDGVYEASDE